MFGSQIDRMLKMFICPYINQYISINDSKCTVWLGIYFLVHCLGWRTNGWTGITRELHNGTLFNDVSYIVALNYHNILHCTLYDNQPDKHGG